MGPPFPKDQPRYRNQSFDFPFRNIKPRIGGWQTLDLSFHKAFSNVETIETGQLAF